MHNVYSHDQSTALHNIYVIVPCGWNPRGNGVCHLQHTECCAVASYSPALLCPHHVSQPAWKIYIMLKHPRERTQRRHLKRVQRLLFFYTHYSASYLYFAHTYNAIVKLRAQAFIIHVDSYCTVWMSVRV